MKQQANPKAVRPKEETGTEEQNEKYRVRMRSAEAVPSAREVDERSVDHATSKSCVRTVWKGRGEAHGHPRNGC